MTDVDKAVNPLHFKSDPADTQIRINPKIWIRINIDHQRPKFQGHVHLALAEVCCLQAYLAYV